MLENELKEIPQNQPVINLESKIEINFEKAEINISKTKEIINGVL